MTRRAKWTGFAAAVALVTAAAVAGVLAFAEKTTPSDWAALVQAIGSVAAIVAAALIAGDQMQAASQTAERATPDRKRAMAEAAAALAQQFSLQVASLVAALEHSCFYIEGRSRTADFDPFKTLVQAVLSLPLHEMPDGASMRMLTQLRNLVGTAEMAFRRAVRMLEDPFEADQVHPKGFDHLLFAAQEQSKQWAELVDKLPHI